MDFVQSISLTLRSFLRRTAVVLGLLILAFGGPVTFGAEPHDHPEETVEVFAEDGTITRIAAPSMPNHPADQQRVAHTNVATLYETGPITNRIAFVTLGDGYTEAQLGTYATHASRIWQKIASFEPFKTYQSYFTVYRVDVVSAESGVDNDPTNGMLRDTALDMYYWCRNIQRLICVNRIKALQYAAQAPQADQIVAIANSTTYGGAGGMDMSTVAGGNIYAPDILVHELGHSLGDLKDEYVLTPGAYGGTEPPAANTSIYTSTTMAQAQVKWHRWLGESTPDGGIIGTYEGASQGDTGIYRPSLSSQMRTFGQPFNSPSREALVMAIYRQVRPIDSSTPITATLTPDDTIMVVPLNPIGHDLTVTWRVNGTIIAAAQNQHTLPLTALALTDQSIVTVEVTDPTPFVRDEAFRTAFMQETRQWTVTVPDPPIWTVTIPLALHGGLETP